MLYGGAKGEERPAAAAQSGRFCRRCVASGPSDGRARPADSLFCHPSSAAALASARLHSPDGQKKAFVRLAPDYDALDVANKIGII